VLVVLVLMLLQGEVGQVTLVEAVMLELVWVKATRG